jgi:hypothetical protein
MKSTQTVAHAGMKSLLINDSATVPLPASRGGPRAQTITSFDAPTPAPAKALTAKESKRRERL